MAALVRIKRRLDEDPLETLILNCKKRKTTENNDAASSEDLSTILRLAGTSEKEENIDTILRKHRLGDAKQLREQFKKHPMNLNEKMRSDMKDNSKNERYKVVNCFRKSLTTNAGSEQDPEEASSSSQHVTILDIEAETNLHGEDETEAATNNYNQQSSNNDAEFRYVYDFYYTSSDDFGDADIEEYVSVYTLNDPLIYGSIRNSNNMHLDEIESEDSSDDSNAENHFRNDYPDEDEDLDSINDDDMIDAVKNLNIDEDLLSSDSEDENFVYSRDEEEFQDEDSDEDNNKADELKFGKLYAKFKAKNKNDVATSTNLPSSQLYYGDIDENEYYY